MQAVQYARDLFLFHPEKNSRSIKQNLRWVPIGAGLVAISLALAGNFVTHISPSQEADWLNRLAQKEDAGAQLQLGLAYREGKYGLAQDSRTGFYWLKRAAQNGNTYAADQLGIAYAQGQGTAMDKASAQHWLQVAADQGSRDARRRLGMASESALEAAANIISGKTLLDQEGSSLQQHAREGDPVAEYQLAMRYRDGSFGVQRDPVLSKQWLERAAAQGNPVAIKTLESDR
jgi:uncharacterized protein